MVRANVDIFEYEDKIVSETKDKYGFRNKNDALNFIIRKFEKHLKEVDMEKLEEKNSLPTVDVLPKEFSSKKTKKKGRPKKKLEDEKKKQDLDMLKNVLSER